MIREKAYPVRVAWPRHREQSVLGQFLLPLNGHQSKDHARLHPAETSIPTYAQDPESVMARFIFIASGGLIKVKKGGEGERFGQRGQP